MKPRTLVLAAYAAALLYAVIRRRRRQDQAAAMHRTAPFETAPEAANAGEALNGMGLGADVAPQIEQGGETVRPGLGDFLRGA
jgi:hypothetical protein